MTLRDVQGLDYREIADVLGRADRHRRVANLPRPPAAAAAAAAAMIGENRTGSVEAAMLSCDEAERHIARAVDGGALDDDRRAALAVHLDRCARCRAARETQRDVAVWPRLRPADRVSPDFLAQLSVRLDEAAGWLGMADWRVWTLRLTPVAAVLALAILFGGSSLDSSITIDEWTATRRTAGRRRCGSPESAPIRRWSRW